MSDKEIEELFREAAESGYARNDEIYKKAGIKAISFEENAVLQQLIAAVGKQTAEEMRNISQIRNNCFQRLPLISSRINVVTTRIK